MLKRTLSTDRTYFLGNYRNIKFFDAISDIPEELAFDQEFIYNIRMLQLVQTDLYYNAYVQLAEEEKPIVKTDDLEKYLTEKQISLLESINTYLQQLNIKQETLLTQESE